MLRPFTTADVPVLAAYRSEPEVARYQGWEAPFSLVQAREFVRDVGAADPTAAGWHQFAIEADGVLVGDVGVGLHENRRQAEIGYTLATAYQGRGYAAEAVRRVLAYLFEVRGLHRVSAECDARNVRSARLLTKLGFRQEGHRVRSTWAKGEWTDDLLFGLLAEQWRAGTT
ncbi:GNAT family N-acetyltransferase [Actinosynnema sp. CA-299493]